MKTITLTKKYAIIICCYGLAAIAVLSGLLYTSRKETMHRDFVIGAVYQHAFSELVTSVTELDTSLKKALYATSPGMASSLYTDIYGKAMAAQMSLGELPFSDIDLSQTSGFIARIGDWAWVLSRNAASGTAISPEDSDNLHALSKAASALDRELTLLAADVTEGVISITDTAAADKINDAAGGFSESVKTIESEFPEIPTLIYDGPFSQHIAQRKPVSLEGMANIDEDTAKQKAAGFAGLDADDFTLLSISEGNLPCFSFSAGDTTVTVTRQGGAVLSYMNSGAHAQSNISADSAIAAAAQFLISKGFSNMKSSYFTSYDGVTLINFTYTQNGFICYPDLVKVGVAADGSIVAFENAGYILNHKERKLSALPVDISDARKLISPELTILREGLSVIPTSGMDECSCFEFICQSSDGSHCIIYVGTESGQQERILLLIEDEHGTLTI